MSREWVQIRSMPNRHAGWIPRDVLEAMGVDCTPLDRCRSAADKPCDTPGQTCDQPGHRQGTIFFRYDLSERIHAHAEFRTELDAVAS